MDICSSFLIGKHQSSVISDIKKQDGLPFQNILTEQDLGRNFNTSKSRNRLFTPEVTLWAFLSQVMSDDQSQQAAVARVIIALMGQRKEVPSANTSAYSQARSRLSETSLASLMKKTALKIKASAPEEWMWRRKCVKLIDGSTLSMPDTVQNQEIYPQSKSQAEGVGFPIARIVAIIDYITGAVLELAIGPYRGKKTGEHALLRELMPSFNKNDVILGDCYYPSFFLMATLIKHGVSGVFPAHSARKYDFRKGKKLGKKDHVVPWDKPAKPNWMTLDEYKEFPSKICVREVSIENHRPGFRTKNRILITTFLDPCSVTKSDLSELYDCRWFVELTFRSIKDTMHMGILRGKTPEMVRKEIWVHLLAYNLIRKVMIQAASLSGKAITNLSFKLALQFIKAFQQSGLFYNDNPESYDRIFSIISYKKVGNRPNRNEPRCVKRRPKPFPRLKKARALYKCAA